MPHEACSKNDILVLCVSKTEISPRFPISSQFLHRLLDLLDLIRRDFALRRQTLSENHHLIVLAWSYVDSLYKTGLHMIEIQQ